MANKITLIITLPNSKSVSYDFDESNDTIRDIYRFVRDSEKIPIKFLNASRLRGLNMNDKISNHFKNFNTIQFFLKMAAYNTCEPDELDVVIDFEDQRTVRLERSPDNTVYSVLHDLIEDIDQRSRTDLTENDVELVYNDEILHPSDELALYPQIARTYIFYMPTVEMKTGIVSKILSNDTYYVYKTIGSKLPQVPQLTLRLKTKNLGSKDSSLWYL